MVNGEGPGTEHRDATWFARQLGDGWISAGDGIYYPPEPSHAAPEPAVLQVEATVHDDRDAYRLPQRRRELLRFRERLVERVARFPNPVTERQLRELERELSSLAKRLGRPARPVGAR
jgi:hypothetical protein